MSDLPRTAPTLLGFLTWGPMSGYDLKKIIDGSVRNFWSESYGQIYPTLKRLLERGLVTRSDESGDGARKRHVYAITDAGRDELQRWLETAPEQQPPRVEILLKLFFGSELGLDGATEYIEMHRAEAVDELQRYAELRPALEAAAANQRAPRFWLMTLRYGERKAEATLAWCEETLAELAQMQLDEAEQQD